MQETEDGVYETPQVVEVGDYAERTLGFKGAYWDGTGGLSWFA